MSEATKNQEVTLWDRMKKLALGKAPLQYAEETAFLEFSSLVLELMEKSQVSKAQLARLLDRDPAFVTRMLSRKNVTLATVARALAALGHQVHLSSEPLDVHASVGFERPANGLQWSEAETCNSGKDVAKHVCSVANSVLTCMPVECIAPHDQLRGALYSPYDWEVLATAAISRTCVVEGSW